MSWLKKIFGGATSRKARLAEANAKTEAERARRMSEAALTNPQDSEAARLAGERRLRKLGQKRGLAGTASSSFASKALLGE